MISLYLIRHGECEGGGTYIGRGSDVPLTRPGINQIRELSKHLRDRNARPERIFCSPLVRTLETAGILGDIWNIRPEPVTGLEESDFGRWEGMSYSEIASVSLDKLESWVDNPWDRAPDGGETLAELERRVYRAARIWEMLIEEEEISDIFIVAHRGPLALLLLKYLDLGRSAFWKFRIDRGSVTKLNLHRGFCEAEFVNLIP